MIRSKNIFYTLAFTAICGIAVIFRFTGINWDSNAHLHPDERFLTMVTTAISWPNTIPEYFDTARSPANPHNKGFTFFVYGTYPMYLTKYIAQTLHRETYNDVTLIGRVLSGVIDLWTLTLVFLITLRLGPDKDRQNAMTAALLSALVYALMVLPIQLSHFFTVDPFATLFLTIALLLMIRGTLGVPLGIAIGLAASAKISALLILPVVAVTYITRWPWFGKTREHWKQRATLIRTGVLLCVGGLATIRIAYPYLFSGWWLNEQILLNWRQLKAFDGISTTFPPALQWIGVPFWKPMLDMGFHGIGIPLGIFTLISILYHVLHIQKQKKVGIILLIVWIVVIFGYQSFQFAKAMRYFYPVYPAVAALTGISLSQLRPRYIVFVLLCLFLIWPIAFVTIYTRPHTRIAASDWIYANIPSNNTLAWEHWDDPLPLSRNTNHIGVYRTIQLTMYDQDSENKWHNLTESLATTDYLILSSNRVYGGIAHAKKRYPWTTNYYTKLFSGELGFQKIKEFTSRPTIFSREFIDDNAEESFTVYDHPKVTILRKVARLSKEQLYERITQ